MGIRGWIRGLVLSEGEQKALQRASALPAQPRGHYMVTSRAEIPKAIQRNFEAAVQSLTNNGWNTGKVPFDTEIATDLLSLRGQARDLVKNNDYARSSLWILHEGVVFLGIWPRPQFKKGKTDELDVDINDGIRIGFKRWAEAGCCDVTGKLTWTDVLRLALQGVVRDGEAFVRKVYGIEHNEFGFTLQMIDPDWIDESLNVDLKNGNRVIMGVEVNAWGRPVAYYYRQDKASSVGVVLNQKPYIRIPAEEMYHLFWAERPDQTRGVPWLRSPQLRTLGLYFAAELAAAASAANKMHFYVKQKEDGSVPRGGDAGDPSTGLEEVEGAFLQQGYPGGAEIVPEGWDVKNLDFNHPNDAFTGFVNAQLRSYAGGLGLSYTSVSQDLSDVNYSTLRHTTLSERDHFKVLQEFLVSKLGLPVYRDWCKAAALTDNVPFKLSNANRYRDIAFVARAYAWVDPLKEIEAKEKEVKLGINSKTKIMEESGMQYEDILDQIKNERRREDEAGLIFSDRMEEITVNGKASGNSTLGRDNHSERKPQGASKAASGL